MATILVAALATLQGPAGLNIGGKEVSLEAPNPPAQAETEPAQVYAATRQGRSKSLWMAEPPTEANPKPSDGAIMTAAEADRSWLSLNYAWVGYETAGALFLRKIVVGR